MAAPPGIPSQRIADGDLGRIGLAVAPTNHKRLYAVVEARNHTALFRSDDAGESWTEVNNSFNISGRPFYFARIIVDPNNPDRVYKPGFVLTVSDDAGKSFSSAFDPQDDPAEAFTAIIHALWINPEELRRAVRRQRWRRLSVARSRYPLAFLQILPVAQFYHVSADMADPYNVYGGLQDNGTWMGTRAPSDGIANRTGENIGFGDGFWAFSIPPIPITPMSNIRAGNLPLPQVAPARSKRYKAAAARERARIPLQLEFADRYQSKSKGHHLSSAGNFSSARATWANPGNASLPI